MQSKRFLMPALGWIGLAAITARGETLVPCEETSLRNAIAVGGSISFACEGVIRVTSPLHVTNEVTLSGLVTLDGAGSTRLFEVTASGKLRLLGLRLQRGAARGRRELGQPPLDWFGGAIVNTGVVVAIDCVFSSNWAFGSSSGPGDFVPSSGAGGAIFNVGLLTVENCRFEGNEVYGGNGMAELGAYSGAPALGGAVFNQSTALVTRCVFAANRTVGGVGSGPGGWDGTAGSGGSARGGAIYNEGLLQIDACTFTHNTVTGISGSAGALRRTDGGWGGWGGWGEGAAIHQSMGTSWVSGSLIASNSAVGGSGARGADGRNGGDTSPTGRGGAGGWGGSVRGIGMCIVGGLSAFTNTTVYANYGVAGDSGRGGGGGSCTLRRGIGSSGGDGGAGGDAKGVGVFVDNATVFSVNNTFANSRGVTGAGSIGGSAGWSCGPVDPAPTNGTPGRPGGLYGDNVALNTGSFTLLNTIIAHGAWQANCSGQFTDAGHNLCSDGSCGFTNVGSMELTSPLLGPLISNAGPTLATALAPSSPAIDHGDDNACPAADQQGSPRPKGAACDIGAVEGSDGIFFPVVTMNLVPATNGVGGISRLQFSISNPNLSSVSGIAFTNFLPPGLVLADVPHASVDCSNGTFLPPEQGSQIEVSELELLPGASCTFSVDVLLQAVGRYTNILHQVYSDLTGVGPLDTWTTVVVEHLPVVLTGESAGSTVKTVRLTGAVRPNGSQTDYWFEFGTNTTDLASTMRVSLPPATTWIDITNELTSLKPATHYHYRLWASNEIGQAAGFHRIFSTLSPGAGTALFLDGIDDFLVTPDLTADFPSESFTFELWFKAERPGNLVVERGLLPPTPGWQNSQLEIVAPSSLVAGVWNLRKLNIGTVVYGTWHHAALRYDKPTARMAGFLDGVEAPSFVSGNRGTPAEGGYQQFWAIGLGSGSPFFQGAIDEVRIWNTARSLTDLRATMNRRLSGAEPGLVCYWRLDDGGGTNALDATGRGRNGTLHNGLTWIVSGIPLRDWLSIAPLAGGRMELDVIGYPAVPYVLDATTNWIDWMALQTNATSSDGRTQFIDVASPQHPVRFYRAIVR